MSSSFGGSGQGDIKYLITIDDSQAIQKLQSIGQQFQTLGNSTQQATQQLKQASPAIDQVKRSTDELQTSQQSFGQVVKDNIGTIISIGTGILGLVSNYTSLQRAQLQINKLQVTEQNQRRMLDVLTRKHAEAVAKYGANSQEALDIQAKIDVLQQKNTNTIEQLNIRQEQLTQSQIGFGLSVVQTGASLVQAASGLKTYKGAADVASVATNRLSMSMNKLKVATVIGAVLVAIEIAAQAVAHNFMGVRDWFDQVYNSLVKLAPAFKPVIDALFTIGEVTTAIFTGDFDKIGKILGGQTAEGAKAAAGGLELMGEEAAAAGKEIEKLNETVEEFRKVGTQLIVEASQGDKGEQRDFLKSLGIKGKEKEKMRDVLDAVEDATKETQQAASKLEALEGFSILEKLGFDIPDDVIEDIQNTIDSDLRDIISGDNDPFNKLAAILEESPNKEKYGETLSKWATENPGLLEALRKFDPRLASAIDGYIALFQTTAQTKLDAVKLTFDPGRSFEENSRILQSLHHDKKDGSSGGGLFDQLFKDFTPANVKKKMGEIMGAIADAITDPEFWHAIGATALSGIFAVGNAINTYIMPWLAEISKTIGDIEFWKALGITALQTLFAIDIAVTKYVEPWLAEIGNTITNIDFWVDVGKRIVGGIVKGLRGEGSLLDLALKGQFTIPVPKDTSNASNSKTLMSLHKNKNKGKSVWDSLSEIGKGIQGFFSQQAFGMGTPNDLQGTDIIRNLGNGKPLFEGGGFNMGGMGSGTDFEQKRISLGDREDKGKPITGLDAMARQIQQITTNLNQYARAIVQVTKNISQWARATVTQTKDNDQLARTIAQITKNNNTFARTVVTVTKDLNQQARATVQNTKNNNVFAKTIVETTKDFNQMARGISQNTKNLNTFARAVNQTTSNVKALTNALNDVPNNVNIRVGLSGPGVGFLDKLI